MRAAQADVLSGGFVRLQPLMIAAARRPAAPTRAVLDQLDRLGRDHARRHAPSR